jgi:hypothetical protein
MNIAEIIVSLIRHCVATQRLVGYIKIADHPTRKRHSPPIIPFGLLGRLLSLNRQLEAKHPAPMNGTARGDHAQPSDCCNANHDRRQCGGTRQRVG